MNNNLINGKKEDDTFRLDVIYNNVGNFVSFMYASLCHERLLFTTIYRNQG
ncbi:hypothetical protein J2T20_003741 [Paenibacillus wynnii]|nr:hypothetical protein [Paenibacillus wynnii]